MLLFHGANVNRIVDLVNNACKNKCLCDHKMFECFYFSSWKYNGYSFIPLLSCRDWMACLKFCLTLSNCSIFVKVQLPGSYKTGRYIFACKYGWFFSVYAYIKNKLILIFNKLIRICANSTLEESCRFYLSLFSRLLINLLLNSLWKSALYRYSVNPKVFFYRVGSCYSK